jgi:16S rRNA (uracil1498-N3)-methyltransferase
VSEPLFFVERVPDPWETVDLTPEDTRHALRALRLRDGETVALSDGNGRMGRGVVAGRSAGRASIRVEEVGRVDRPSPSVSVALAPPKGDRLSWAVQKLTEVGVDRIVLLSSERAVRVLGNGDAGLDRQRAVAREAAMQSHRPFLCEVLTGDPLDDIEPEGTRVLLDPSGDVSVADALPEAATEVELLIGPEGGWTDLERKRAGESGATIARLGPSILRTETAAMVAATLALARYGRMG